MEPASTRSAGRQAVQEQRQYRIERQFSSRRPPEELVRDLLRAHCGA